MVLSAPLVPEHVAGSDAPSVIVRDLRKTYTVAEREAGVGASLRSLVRRTHRQVHAVDGITFTVAPGEVVGFLGPNGAGKTTTLKMLCGLLYPSSGEVRVLGFQPARREHAYLRRITMVMGNKSQLQWDLPASDFFQINRVLYRLSDQAFRDALDELIDLLDLGPLLKKQVRSLSLGERMKCELAAALLYRPEVLFLDEPTLGLDVTMQSRIRGFISAYNARTGATVLLTSHYMADVTALCRRVIVIHHGRLLYDGPLDDLAGRIAPFKVLRVDLEGGMIVADPERYGKVESQEGGKLTLRVPKEQAPAITARLLAELPVIDLTVEDPPIESVIEQVFAGGAEESPP
ncbi:MAG TPA: ATP-binding cassette domain-containing protein [Chloroflexota bacterium]|jgi:ABC-2 type transport system ATP-binding protein